MLCVVHDVVFGPKACHLSSETSARMCLYGRLLCCLGLLYLFNPTKVLWSVPCEGKVSHDLELCGAGR